MCLCFFCAVFFFFQAEDGIRDLVRSRGLGDVYKRQDQRVAQRLLLGDVDATDVDAVAHRRGRVGRAVGGLTLSLIHI